MSVKHTADAEAPNQSIHVSHCQLVRYYVSQTHSCCWGKQSINTCKSQSVSPVLHQSNTQLMLKHPINQYMSLSVTPVLYQSNTQLMLKQSINHVSHCQLVQYYISQTHSWCWSTQSINTCKSLSAICQSDTAKHSPSPLVSLPLCQWVHPTTCQWDFCNGFTEWPVFKRWSLSQMVSQSQCYSQRQAATHFAF